MNPDSNFPLDPAVQAALASAVPSSKLGQSEISPVEAQIGSPDKPPKHIEEIEGHSHYGINE
jgi:hypothetical protein